MAKWKIARVILLWQIYQNQIFYSWLIRIYLIGVVLEALLYTGHAEHSVENLVWKSFLNSYIPTNDGFPFE